MTLLFILLPNVLIVIGTLLILVGTIEYIQSKKPAHIVTKQSLVENAANLAERKIAVENAIKNGQKTYSYTTNFIPGIGRIINSPQTEAQLQQQLKTPPQS